MFVLDFSLGDAGRFNSMQWRFLIMPSSYINAFNLVRDIISQVTGTSANEILKDDGLVVDLKMDSIEIIDLIMRLEERGYVLDEREITSSLTVGGISHIISAVQ